MERIDVNVDAAITRVEEHRWVYDSPEEEYYIAEVRAEGPKVHVHLLLKDTLEITGVVRDEERVLMRITLRSLWKLTDLSFMACKLTRGARGSKFPCFSEGCDRQV